MANETTENAAPHPNCPWIPNQKFVLEALERIEESLKENSKKMDGLVDKVHGLENFKSKIAAIGGVIAFIVSGITTLVSGLLSKN